MSDNTFPKEKNSKRGSASKKKSSEPTVNELSQFFSSLLNLSAPYEQRPPRRPKITTNHADFIQKNSEIHQMATETNDSQISSKNWKKKGKQKNIAAAQSQESCSFQSSEFFSTQFHLQHTEQSSAINNVNFGEESSEVYQIVNETNELKQSPKKRKKKKDKKSKLSIQCQQHICLENQEDQTDEVVSIETQQFFSSQNQEIQSLETREFISVESGSSGNLIYSQEASTLEIKSKKPRKRKSRKNNVPTDVLPEASSSVQVQENVESKNQCTATKSKPGTKSKPDKKLHKKSTSENGEEASTSKKEKKEGESEKFPAKLTKINARHLLETQSKDDPTFVEGYIRINVKFYKHAYVSVPGNEMDILIVGIRDRNCALEGDLVVVEINPKDKWCTYATNEVQKTGVVLCILEEIHPRKAIGFLKKHQNGALFQPRDPRIPYLRIFYPESLLAAVNETPESFENILYLAKLKKWEKPGFAIGKLLEVVGNTGDLVIETNAILLENDLNVQPFEDKLLKGLPPKGYIPTRQDLEGREDWRNHCVFTIDPATAEDLDDAVSCQPLINGNYEVGVHISDVTHFVKAFTPLDTKIADRATTVYLVDNVYHMLPKQLCDVCSLKPGQDKLTFSVIWEMTPCAEIVRQRFAKTAINSCCQMSYQQAQAMIENPLKDWSRESDLVIKGDYEASDLCETVNNLYKLSLQMRQRRFENGALRIDQPKLYISLDTETGLPVSCSLEEVKDSNRLIEEFMLLANMSVAKNIYETIPETALLRSHKEPSNRILSQTREMLEKFGVILNVESSGALQDSLKQYESESTENFAAKCRMLVINSLCARSMTRAVYRCSNSVKNEEDLRHYALSVPLYTHFTSPIRRYPDCIVHRLLEASIKNYSLPEPWKSSLCTKLASNCNVKKYAAKVAQEQSTELFFTYLLDMRGPTNTQAVVMDVKDRSIDVIIIEAGLKVRIYLADIEEEIQAEFSVEHSAPTIKIQWVKSDQKQVINVFSIIDIQIQKHPSFFRLHGILLAPAPKNDAAIPNGLTKNQRKKQRKKQNKLAKTECPIVNET